MPEPHELRMVIKTFDGALRLFGRGGTHWVNGPPQSPDNYCVLTALARATTSLKGERDRDAFRSACMFLRRAIWPRRNIVRWNDARERTWQEVRVAFLKARTLAERELQ